MERLIICGGGHVSLALAHMASILDFDITVIDDRPEFANQERFPMVSQVLCMGFEEALDQLGSRADDYYVIVTRGHAFDRDCLAHVLRGKYAYAGMIGSKGKVAAVMKSLLAEGFPQEQLDGVHSPIGIKLGGQSPVFPPVVRRDEGVGVQIALEPDLQYLRQILRPRETDHTGASRLSLRRPVSSRTPAGRSSQDQQSRRGPPSGRGAANSYVVASASCSVTVSSRMAARRAVRCLEEGTSAWRYRSSRD